MLTTPSTAFVGSPAFVDNGGIAWKARYRYDEPSTRTSRLALILPLVVRLLILLGARGRVDALDRPLTLGQRQRPCLAAARSRGSDSRDQCDARASRHDSSLRFKS